jgi:hypothetical protein
MTPVASLRGYFFYCPFTFNSKLLTLQVNKKTTTGKPVVVIFLLSG